MCISSKSRRLAAVIGLSLCGVASARDAVVSIYPSAAGPRVNPRMYGVFLEEINHGVDGGLYAELVRNRAFEDGRPPEGYQQRGGRWLDANGFPAGVDEFGYKIGGVPFWSLVRTGDSAGAMHLETSGGITTESSYCLRLEVENLAGGQIGVANDGFFGIGVRQGDKYQLSLYARSGRVFNGPLTVRLEDAAGNACSSSATFDGIGSEWKQYKADCVENRNKSAAGDFCRCNWKRMAGFRIAVSSANLESAA
jgi:hypothetical protein